MDSEISLSSPSVVYTFIHLCSFTHLRQHHAVILPVGGFLEPREWSLRRSQHSPTHSYAPPRLHGMAEHHKLGATCMLEPYLAIFNQMPKKIRAACRWRVSSLNAIRGLSWRTAVSAMVGSWCGDLLSSLSMPMQEHDVILG
jgi:hypothetical protein